MFVTQAELRRQLAEAWGRGYTAGYSDGDRDAEYARDGAMGYSRGPEPVAAPNPWA